MKAVVLMGMLSCVTLNCNGKWKWKPLWHFLNSHGADVIALQETHLTMELEFAFKTYAPSMDTFFSHGTSQSRGVLIALRCSINASGSVVTWLGKHGIVLDVQQDYDHYRIINVCVPVEGDKRKVFD